MKHKVLLLFMAIILATSLVIGASCRAEVEEAPPFKIGFIAMMTGFVSGAGPLEELGANYALDEVGWEIDGRKIELVWEDGASDVDVCVEKARKLVEVDNVDVIVGPVFTEAFAAVAAYLAPHKVPVLHAFSQSTWILEAGAGNVFIPGDVIANVYGLGAYAAKDKGYKTAAIAMSDAVWMYDTQTGFQMGFEENGGEVIQTQAIPMGTTDMLPYLLTMEKADVVGFIFTWLDNPVFVQQYNDYGAKMPLMCLDAAALSVPVLQELGEIGLGIIAPAQWSPLLDNPKNKAFVDGFFQKYGYLPEDTIEGNYRAMHLVFEAARLVGDDTSREALLEAFYKIDMDTDRGRVTVTPEGYAWGDTSYIVEVVYSEKYGSYAWGNIAAYHPSLIK